MINFSCPICNQMLNVPESSAGKKGKCPQCGNLLDIPMTSVPENEPPPPPPPLSFQQEPEPAPVLQAAAPPAMTLDRPPSPIPANLDRPPKSTSVVMEYLIASLVLGGVAFVGSFGIGIARQYGVFAAVMGGLVCLGLAGFALVLAILGLLKVQGTNSSGFWYVLGALALSGTGLINSLTMFIAVLAWSPPKG
jgi:hypothetical protein